MTRTLNYNSFVLLLKDGGPVSVSVVWFGMVSVNQEAVGCLVVVARW